MKKFPARPLLVSDRNNDILWEPRPVPLMKKSLGISQRAELARRAMAEPIPDRQPVEDFDGLAPARCIAWAIGITALSVSLIGLGVLIWASI
jgi:hypothetical protein